MIANAVYSVAEMLVVMAVGFFIACSRFYREARAEQVLNKYLSAVAIPIYLFYNVLSAFSTRTELLVTLAGLFVPIAVILAQYLAGFALCRVLRVQAGRQGAFIDACALSNIVFLGFPVVTSVFGEKVIPDGMVFYIANTLLFWTLGTYLLRVDGGQKKGFFRKENLIRIFSPAMIGLLAGVAVRLTGLPLPDFLAASIKNISATCPPLGLMFVGASIRSAKPLKEGFLRDIVVLFAARYLVMPVLLGLIFFVLPISVQSRQVFYILALMPAMTQLGIMAHSYHSDSEFTGAWIAISSVIGVVTIPVFAWLLQNVFIYN
ncbi:AEC family transporter [Marasmitruncus massiliensis]|uniref:AEC family transporter n=1 Tax=Marasmitruncus massiliensis TaxID=1944642 RepID=UPI000C7CA756|nr:AEC family transporter [Marasmitruncus massiliensis]